MPDIEKTNTDELFKQIKELIQSSRNAVLRTVDTAMVITYFQVGYLIIEHEQKGKLRAEYSKSTLSKLSKKLNEEFGKGFSVPNLERMRIFFILYKDRISSTLLRNSEIEVSQISSTMSRNSKETISQTQSAKSNISETLSRNFDFPLKLSWSHYVLLMSIDNPDERNFYEIEAYNQNWSVRELKRQFNSSLYERLALSRDKDKIKELSEKGHIVEKPADIIKNPLILEFLGLEEKPHYSEYELETEIINKLEKFLLELGKGFLFDSRQKRISFDDNHFYIDLVFYNRILKCFVLIDLKIGKLTHQDIGQMQMYVNYYDRQMKADDENKTIGIILCKEAHKAVVEFTLPEDNEQIFASRYSLYLPSKQELIAQIEGME